MKNFYGIYNPLQAKLLELFGSEYAWISGYGISASNFGLPDLDIMSYSEKLIDRSRIVTSTKLKCLIDIDNGIENPYGMARYLEGLNAIKPYGICVEDERHPKVSALYKSKQPLLDTEEYIRRLKVISNLFKGEIYPRTNCITRDHDIDLCIERINQIAENGPVRRVVVHSKSFNKVEQILNRLDKDIEVILITSLMNTRPKSHYKDIGLSGVIIGHNLLFETVNHQNKIMHELVNGEIIPEVQQEGKALTSSLLMGETNEHY